MGPTACVQIEAEHSALRKGQRLEAISRVAFGAGTFTFHGDGEGRSDEDWSLTFVRERDRAVLPLLAGAWSEAEAECLGRQQIGTPLDDQRFPAVVYRGARRLFRAVGGRHLVGVVEFDGVDVLLGAIGSSFFVIVRQGASRHVIPTGPSHGLPELNLDALLPELERSTPRVRRRKADAEPQEKIADLADHHDRILHGQVPSPENPRVVVPGVIRQGLLRLADRAAAWQICRPRRARGKPALGRAAQCAVRRSRGTRFIYRLVEIFERLGAIGCGDLVGRLGDLCAKIRDLLPGVKFKEQALSDGLHRLHACKTCIVRKLSPRRWHVRLAGLTDWRTALHRQFCAETSTEFRLEPETPDAPHDAKPPPPPPASDAPSSKSSAAEGSGETSSSPGAGASAPADPPSAAGASTTSTKTPPDEVPTDIPTTTAQGEAEPSSADADTTTTSAQPTAPGDTPTTTTSSGAPPDTRTAITATRVDERESAPATPPRPPTNAARTGEPRPFKDELHKIYDDAKTKIEELFTAKKPEDVAPRDHAPTVPHDDIRDASPTADAPHATTLPSAPVMTVVAAIAVEGLDQCQAQLRAARADAAREAAARAREAAAYAREREVLIRDKQNTEAEAKVIVERAERVLQHVSGLADLIDGADPQAP